VRLWTLHPQYLDAPGLTAVWREGLLAKAVLRGRTAGYRHHPQLERFRAAADPVGAVNAYLHAIYLEARRRGYRFNAAKLRGPRSTVRIPATRGQLAYEWLHLKRKLRQRAPAQYRALLRASKPRAHPLFRIGAGPIAAWERGAP
jgi:hypothetical protein